MSEKSIEYLKKRGLNNPDSENNGLYIMKQQLATRFSDQDHINLTKMGIKREDVVGITVYEGSAYLWYFDYPHKPK